MTYNGLNINISSQRYQLCDYITISSGCSTHDSYYSNLIKPEHINAIRRATRLDQNLSSLVLVQNTNYRYLLCYISSVGKCLTSLLWLS